MPTHLGDVGIVNLVTFLFTFPVLQLGTFAPRVGKVLIHTGATHYSVHQELTGCHSPSLRGEHHIYVSAVWSRHCTDTMKF